MDLQRKITFPLSLMTMAVLLPSAYVVAQTAEEGAVEEEVELQTIHVYSKRAAKPYKYDVTGLGEIRKTADHLQREQVENIRDLTRYDPDIGVNEAGGRGTTRGFSMRGVERERVAVEVDGFGAAPVLKKDSPTSGYHRVHESSSSIMETEYENLKEVDLRKGSASAEMGSGALGGGVSMITKDASDFFGDDENKQIAGRLKAGYTSKNHRHVYSLGLAGRTNGLEGFIQYTRRGGEEIKAHKDLYKTESTISHYQFVNNDLSTVQTSLGAKDVSGPARRVPNPLDFKSESLLSKAGYHITPEHYLGFVLENTKQEYSLRDMFLPNYYFGSSTDVKSYEPFFSDKGILEQYKYTPTRYYIDNHDNKRLGVEYKYLSKDKSSWLDQATVRLDRRFLEMQSTVLTLSCSPWPTVNKNCFPSDAHYEKGQLGDKHFITLKEKDWRADIALAKKLMLIGTEHQLQLKSGIIFSRYEVANYWQSQYNLENTVAENYAKSRKEAYFIYGPHSTGHMRGRNFFVSLSDRIRLNDVLSANLAIRFDKQKYSANPSLAQQGVGLTFRNAKYDNVSWDFGIAYRPIQQLQFTYRASTGFRNPSIIELIGPGFNNERFDPERDRQGPLKAERSFNQEVGAEFLTPFLKLSGSYFVTQYRDVIGRAVLRHDNPSLPGYATNDLYFNLHNFTTHGFDIKSSIDAYSLWDKLPEGLEFNLNVGVTKIKKRKPLSPKFGIVSSYSFDAIQPLRVVYGVEYHDPDEKWGISLVNTYSKAKDISELEGESRQNTLTTQGVRSAKLKTRSWMTTDIMAYYNFNKYITARAGIYNVFNYRYVTWESVRQTSFGYDARLSTQNYTALAAPGRNFALSLEMKF